MTAIERQALKIDVLAKALRTMSPTDPERLALVSRYMLAQTEMARLLAFGRNFGRK